MLDTRPSMESTWSALSSGLNSEVALGVVWIGFTRSDSVTFTLTSCCRLYLPSAQALPAEASNVATSTTFILDMAVPFSPAGLQHSGETRASGEALTMTTSETQQARSPVNRGRARRGVSDSRHRRGARRCAGYGNSYCGGYCFGQRDRILNR